MLTLKFNQNNRFAWICVRSSYAHLASAFPQVKDIPHTRVCTQPFLRYKEPFVLRGDARFVKCNRKLITERYQGWPDSIRDGKQDKNIKTHFQSTRPGFDCEDRHICPVQK